MRACFNKLYQAPIAIVLLASSGAIFAGAGSAEAHIVTETRNWTWKLLPTFTDTATIIHPTDYSPILVTDILGQTAFGYGFTIEHEFSPPLQSEVPPNHIGWTRLDPLPTTIKVTTNASGDLQTRKGDSSSNTAIVASITYAISGNGLGVTEPVPGKLLKAQGNSPQMTVVFINSANLGDGTYPVTGTMNGVVTYVEGMTGESGVAAGFGAFTFLDGPSTIPIRFQAVPAPGPLPILGVAAVFSYSRKIGKRIKNASPEAIRTI
jgi:hypothetical protein